MHPPCLLLGVAVCDVQQPHTVEHKGCAPPAPLLAAASFSLLVCEGCRVQSVINRELGATAERNQVVGRGKLVGNGGGGK